jgi:hypothetical protein
MKHGEICTVSGGKGYAGKPRPAVIVGASDVGSFAGRLAFHFSTSSG